VRAYLLEQHRGRHLRARHGPGSRGPTPRDARIIHRRYGRPSPLLQCDARRKRQRAQPQRLLTGGEAAAWGECAVAPAIPTAGTHARVPRRPAGIGSLSHPRTAVACLPARRSRARERRRRAGRAPTAPASVSANGRHPTGFGKSAWGAWGRAFGVEALSVGGGARRPAGRSERSLGVHRRCGRPPGSQSRPSHAGVYRRRCRCPAIATHVSPRQRTQTARGRSRRSQGLREE
jgi:hypothetical protein